MSRRGSASLRAKHVRLLSLPLSEWILPSRDCPK